MNSPTLLVAGLGDIGGGLAKRMAMQGRSVIGLRRSAQPLEGVDVRRTDLAAAPPQLNALPGHIDDVVIVLSAGRRDLEHYRAAYVTAPLNLAAALRTSGTTVGRWWLVSSTGVFGAHDGWIDEDTEPTPESATGQVLLDGEQALAQALACDNQPLTILRLAGIYGPGRQMLIRRLREGRISPASPPQYSNRIHRDDVIGAIEHLIHQQEHQTIQSLYHLSDGQGAPLHEVERWLAQQLGIDPASLSETTDPRRGGSKRIANARLLASGYTLQYPDYQSGYRQLLQHDPIP